MQMRRPSNDQRNVASDSHESFWSVAKISDVIWQPCSSATFSKFSDTDRLASKRKTMLKSLKRNNQEKVNNKTISMKKKEKLMM
jgi:hypothetical protein